MAVESYERVVRLTNLAPFGQLKRLGEQRFGEFDPALDMRSFEMPFEVVLARLILME